MKTRMYIVEDQFAEAHSLQLMLERAGYEVAGIARSLTTAIEEIDKTNPHLVLLDIFLKGKGSGIDLARILRKKNIAFVYITANFDATVLASAKETQPYGFVIKPFRESDILVTLEIALFRHEFSLESNYYRLETIQQQLEVQLAKDSPEIDSMMELGEILQPHIPFDFLMINKISSDQGVKQIGNYYRIGYREYQRIGNKEWFNMAGLDAPALAALLKTMPIVSEARYCNKSFEDGTSSSALIKLMGGLFKMKSLCCVPVFLHYDMPIQLSFFSKRTDGYSTNHLDLLNNLRNVLQRYFQKGTASHSADVENATAKVVNNNKIPDEETMVFPGIIGKSHGLLAVFDGVTQVAPFDTSVLLLGESGTGKERVAECLQRLSSRKDMAFVKVNCGVLPPTLIESELFGHEKGAFTGANETHKGYFEEAMNGTIFLDEIGELPMEAQVKLLRILQEKEIRRVGGKVPLKVNVRIIAATNCDLEALVAQGKFRLDLYYRLNVFPIHLPSLRERKEDIRLLAYYFMTKYARMTGKRIDSISEKAVEQLMEYDWPGNIRELENLMERSVVTNSGNVIKEFNLKVSVKPKSPPATSEQFEYKTIEENEREYILSVLKQCKGRIWGKEGAASLLNMPPTTLNSRIKKLGIKREFTS